MDPPGQNDEIATGHHQQRHGRSEFLNGEPRAPQQKVHFAHRNLSLIFALAVYA
jgi:hypothetical protein